MKIQVWSEERGYRTLKEGITLETYQAKYPSAIAVKKPCMATLEKWHHNGGCKAIDDCWVEPDGTCEHGKPSWLIALYMI